MPDLIARGYWNERYWPAGYFDVSYWPGLSPPLGEPTAPSALAVAKYGSIGMDLTWTDGDDATIIYIERSLTTGSGFAVVGSVLPGDEYYGDRTCAPETTYYYRVRAWNAAGYSDYSDEDSDTTDAAGAPVDHAAGGFVPIHISQRRRR